MSGRQAASGASRKRLGTDLSSKLEPMAPTFVAEYHDVYRARLAEGLRDHRNRMIALTGDFGVGKSSVIAGLISLWRVRWLRPASVSFGALAVDDGMSVGESSTEGSGVEEEGEGNSGATRARSRTNSIQKELIKQLLFQTRADFPHFAKIRPLSKMRLLVETALLGSLFSIAGVLLVPNIENGSENVVAFAQFAIIVAGAAGLFLYVLLRVMTHNRTSVKALGAGGASIELSAGARTYLDEYLDEIVYFFRVRHCRLLVIEDLDRLGDLQIFDDLQLLNKVVNNALRSGFLGSFRRPVQFLFAVRDSLFEHVAVGGDSPSPAEARTKYFDLIIPIAPALSVNSNVPVLESMFAAGVAPPQAVLQTLSPYLLDFRVARNVVNEYEVFAQIVGATAEVERARLFALVAYKNLHLRDFERIRLGTSALDVAYSRHRAGLLEAQRDLSAHIDDVDSRPDLTRQWGRRLRELALYEPGDGRQLAAVVNGEIWAEARWSEVDFWVLVAAAESLEIIVTRDDGQRVRSVRGYSAQEIELYLGREIDGVELRTASEEERARLEEQLLALRRATWRDRPADSLEGLAKSFPAESLLEQGFLDEYFASYLTAHQPYGERRIALFARSAISDRRADPAFGFSESEGLESAREVLRRHSSSLIDNDALVNESLLRVLIGDESLGALRRNLELRLASGQVDPNAFDAASRSLLQLAPPEQLRYVKLLAHSPRAFLILTDAGASPDLLGASLVGALESVTYDSSDGVREYVRRSFPDIAILQADELDRNGAAALAALLAGMGSIPLHLKSSSREVARALLLAGAPLDFENLRAARPTHRPLDELIHGPNQDVDLARRVLDEFDLYLDIMRRAGESHVSSTGSAQLILSGTERGWVDASTAEALAGSFGQRRVDDLSVIAVDWWPVLFVSDLLVSKTAINATAALTANVEARSGVVEWFGTWSSRELDALSDENRAALADFVVAGVPDVAAGTFALAAKIHVGGESAIGELLPNLSPGRLLNLLEVERDRQAMSRQVLDRIESYSTDQLERVARAVLIDQASSFERLSAAIAAGIDDREGAVKAFRALISRRANPPTAAETEVILGYVGKPLALVMEESSEDLLLPPELAEIARYLHQNGLTAVTHVSSRPRQDGTRLVRRGT